MKESSNMIAELQSLAEEFRAAILKARRSFPDFLKRKLESFPENACEHASVLLALYLKEKGFTKLRYSMGTRGSDDKRHVWLEIENIIIDITADQFPAMSDSVIVTQNRSWHLSFRVQPEYPVAFETQFEGYNKATAVEYNAAYLQTVKHIPGRCT